MSYRVGDKVRWRSFTRGKVEHYVGVVLQVVAAHADVAPVVHGYLAAGTHTYRHAKVARPRPRLSYLVELPPKTQQGRPMIFWPEPTRLMPE